MIEQKVATPIQAPSRGRIATAVVVTLIVAVIILFVAILPAEYGVDPLGTGQMLGLNELAAAENQTLTPPNPQATISPILRVTADGNTGFVSGTTIAQTQEFKVDSREYELNPEEGMELKYNMKQGGGLVFSWTADKPVQYEFHAEPNVRPTRSYYESYEIDDKEGKAEGHGTFIAPTTGIHGWYWKNISTQPIKVRLKSAGHYDWIQESYRGKQTAIDAKAPE